MTTEENGVDGLVTVEGSLLVGVLVLAGKLALMVRDDAMRFGKDVALERSALLERVRSAERVSAAAVVELAETKKNSAVDSSQANGFALDLGGARLRVMELERQLANECGYHWRLEAMQSAELEKARLRIVELEKAAREECEDCAQEERIRNLVKQVAERDRRIKDLESVAREVAARSPAAAPERVCVECGCTDAAACPGGCSWVNMCSSCVIKTRNLVEKLRNSARLSVHDSLAADLKARARIIELETEAKPECGQEELG